MRKEIQLIALDHSNDLYCIIGFGSFFQGKPFFNDIDLLFVGISNENFQLYKILKEKCSNLSSKFGINFDFNFLTKQEYRENLYLDIVNKKHTVIYLNQSYYEH